MLFFACIDSSYRHLIDYKGARYLAKFISTRFVDVGFTATHPLKYDSSTNLSCLASKIIADYVSGSTDQLKVQHYLLLLLKSRIINDVEFQGVSSLRRLQDIIKEKRIKLGPFSYCIIHKLGMMNNATEGKDKGVNMDLHDLELNPDENTKLRSLIKNGLAKALKEENRKVIEKFMQKYRIKGLNTI